MVDVMVNDHEMLDISAKTMADALYEGELDDLIKFIGETDFDECVKAAVPYSDHPEMLIGWLREQYREWKEHLTTEDEEKENMVATMSEINKKLATIVKLEGEPTDEHVVEAITKLVNAQQTSVTSFTEMDSKVKAMQRKLRLFEWKDKIIKFDCIPGTPDELATKLVDVEEKGGTDTAEYVYKQFETQQKQGETIKLTARNLSPGNANGGNLANKKYDFEEAAKKMAEADKITVETAIARLATKDAMAWGKYRQEKAADLAGI